MSYLRSRHGDVVHRSGCGQANGSQPWTWANKKFTSDEILLANLPAWIRPCHYCLSPRKTFGQETQREQDIRVGNVMGQETIRLCEAEAVEYRRVMAEFPEFWPQSTSMSR